MPNKRELLLRILDELESARGKAITAAHDARETATNKENVAESRYDTLGLEAAYLAHGQSNRVLDIESDIEGFQRILATDDDPPEEIQMGSLVSVEDELGLTQHLYIGAGAGGLSVVVEDLKCVVVTLSSPFGQSLKGLLNGDEFELSDTGKRYTVSNLS